MKDFLELQNLNDKQKEAVLKTDGVMLIIAAPGAGKTKVLTTKIAYLLHKNIAKPGNILSLTFTNKAAKEMKNRIQSMVGDQDISDLLAGTFHSCFVKLLRSNSDKIGFSSNFTIYDTSDSKDVISSIVEDLKLKPDVYTPYTILERISIIKNRMIDSTEYQKNNIYLEEDKKFKIPEFYKIYSRYENYLKEVNVMDFDDILLNTYKLLKKNKDVLSKYQDCFKYIFVDEFQDTNLVQYEIIKMLAEKNKNICVVGDDSQSIYAFRGATIKNIVNFKKDYKDCTVIKLEQNYRSTKNIVGLANSLIKKNKERIDKNIWTDNDEGSKCKIIKCSNGVEEARMIAMLIKNKIKDNEYNEEDIAVLYRTNIQARLFETEFRAQDINYRICGGMSFYQYEEIKDVIAFLRVVVNTNDVEAIKRTINKPRRGIGNTTMDHVYALMKEKGMKLWDILVQSRALFGLRIAELLQKYVALVQPFIEQVKTKNAYEIASELCDKVGFLQYYKELDTEEGMEQYENVNELLNSIKMFVDDPNNVDKSLISYLQNLPLESEKIEEEKEIREQEENDIVKKKVSLMTVHSSKGLEYKCIYIVGFEEGIFPSFKSTTNAAIEEERRLFYVAITRAKDYLGISYSLSRYVNGKVKECKPSRFLDDLDDKFLDDHVITMNVIKNNIKEEKKDHANYSMFKYSIVSRKINENSRVVSGNIKNGAPVFHSRYGNGKIIGVNASDENIIRVKFAKYGEKELVKDLCKVFVFDNNTK